jgi:DegV family protein with EDD domain
VSVIDSETTAGGLGLIALAAARRARAGAVAEEIVEHVANARSEMKMWFAVDTLEYLKRSGRVGAASAWIGSTLKVKPILTVEREIAPIERVRTSARAFERMVDYARQRQASGADAWTVQHIQAPAEAVRLVERCREIFSNEPAFVSELGPIVGIHAGPGLIGVGALPSSYLA